MPTKIGYLRELQVGTLSVFPKMRGGHVPLLPRFICLCYSYNIGLYSSIKHLVFDVVELFHIFR